jgi:hypothetical protein
MAKVLRKFQNPRYHASFYEDFIGIDGDPPDATVWDVTVEAGVTSTAVLAEGFSGRLEITLGATADDFANVASPLFLYSDTPCRVNISFLPSMEADIPDNICVGVTDAKTEANGNLCLDVTPDAPDIVPTDAALWIYESANGGDLWYMGCANDDTDTTVATDEPLEGAYHEFGVEWDADRNVYFYFDNELMGTIEEGLQEDVMLCIIIASSHVGGTGNPYLGVSYVFAEPERNE